MPTSLSPRRLPWQAVSEEASNALKGKGFDPGSIDGGGGPTPSPRQGVPDEEGLKVTGRRSRRRPPSSPSAPAATTTARFCRGSEARHLMARRNYRPRSNRDHGLAANSTSLPRRDVRGAGCSSACVGSTLQDEVLPAIARRAPVGAVRNLHEPSRGCGDGVLARDARKRQRSRRLLCRRRRRRVPDTRRKPVGPGVPHVACEGPPARRAVAGERRVVDEQRGSQEPDGRSLEQRSLIGELQEQQWRGRNRSASVPPFHALDRRAESARRRRRNTRDPNASRLPTHPIARAHRA